MIQAVIYQDERRRIKGFKVEGHAAYADPGSDIVCSAVSAVVFTALGAMDEMAGFKRFVEKNGSITCFIPNRLEKESLNITEIVLKAMVIGLKQIEAEYGQYVRVRYEEV